MDPISAISLAGNIIAFVDLSTKLLKVAKEVHTSLSGVTEENRSRELLVSEMKAFSSKLLAPEDPSFVGEDAHLCKLAKECRDLATQLIELLSKIKAKDPKSKRESVWSSVKNKYYEKDRQELEQRLENCRTQLNIQLNHLTSQDIKGRLKDILNNSNTNAAKLVTLGDSLDRVRERVEARSFSAAAQSQLRQLLGLQDEVFTAIAQNRVLKSLEFETMHGRFDMVDEAHYKTFNWMFDNEVDLKHIDDSHDERLSQDDLESRSDAGDDQYTGLQTLNLEQSIDDYDTNEGITGSRSTYQEYEVERAKVEGSPNLVPGAKSSDRGDRNAQKHSSDKDDTTRDEKAHVSEYGRPDDLERDQMIELDATKRVAREKFLSWLSNGRGVFHVSGKLGSGKSTLMKFLCTRVGTHRHLDAWTGNRTLVFANFFFWKPGTSRQKSLAGLYRGLLYSIMKSCPELIPQLLPDTWAVAIVAPWQTQTAIDISEREVWTALTRLIQHQTLTPNYCFCFFIDGLDEFEETTQYDYRAVAELLCSWSDEAPESIKLCISSREYNVFMNMFSTDRRLRLHELTWQDMKSFISAKLSHLPDSEDRLKLVTSIIRKAQGIFLWVALVTKSIRDQLENGATVYQMERELETIPDEMNGLYEHIIKSLSPTSRKRAYRNLKLLEEAKSYQEISISLLAYSFLEDYDQDPEFAMKDDFVGSGMRSMTREQRIEAARKSLVGSCRGLIEPNSSNDLDYTHRSVAEFLAFPNIRDAMISSTSNFNVPDAISQLLLAEIRMQRPQIQSEGKFNVVTRNQSGLLFLMRGENKLDHLPYAYLSFFERVIDPFPWEDLNNVDYGEWMISFPESHTLICTSGGGRTPHSMTRITLPLHILTVLGYHDYPIWKILHDTATVDTVTKATFLMYCAINHVHYRSGILPSKPSVFDVLLDRSLLGPNTKTHLWPIWHKWAGDRAELTIWQHFLVKIFLDRETDSRPDIFNFRSNISNFRSSVFYGRIVEGFLRHKPALNFAMTLGPVETESPGVQHRFAVIRSGPDLSESIKIDCWTWISGEPFVYPSLRTWIEQTELENKDRLLQMYDSQVEETRTAKHQNDSTAPYIGIDPEYLGTESVDDRQGSSSPDTSDVKQCGSPERLKMQSPGNDGPHAKLLLSKYFFLIVIITGILIAALVPNFRHWQQPSTRKSGT